MSQTSTLFSIQYLRFIAATMVVVLHVSHSLAHNLGSPTASIFAPGVTGVDIFFVISGFIMVMISRNTRRSAAEFFLMRLTRIAPSYWLCTTLVLILVLVRPQLFFASSFDPAQVVASYLFIPWANSAGHVHPLLHVGWTLNLEFLFYSVVALTLLLPGTASMKSTVAMAVLCGLSLVGFLFHPEQAILAAWTSSFMLEFALGMVVARLYFHDWTLPVPLALLCVALGFAVLLQQDQLGGIHDATRWIKAGLPSFLIVYGALSLEKRGWVPELPLLRYLGDVSFALYLTHYFALGVVRALWPREMIGGMANDLIFFGLAISLAFVGGALFYNWLEKPLVGWFQSTIKGQIARRTA